MKPIKLYTTHAGPNPLKVALILDFLDVPYEEEIVLHSDLKGAEYTAINPNGRLPALYDPNTNITLWESAAMIEYICDKYDNIQHRLSFPAGSRDHYHAKQWLYFQASGQGPYYGQASWFRRFHPEKLPSAEQRYIDEVRRVMLVLDGWLAHHRWLVGDKMSYVDLAWIPWQRVMTKWFAEEGLDGAEMPHYKDWMSRMLAVAEVKESLRVADEKAAVAWPKLMALIDSQKV